MPSGMKSHVMLCATLAALAGVPAAAFAWAAGTHAYIAVHTAKKAGLTDASALCNRTYGANAVDMFNRVFTPEGKLLAAALHDPAGDGNVQPWHAAVTPAERAFGYGFASHNDAWGTDSIAHYTGITFGKDVGYIIAKAGLLREELRPLVQGALPMSEDQLLLVSHILVEYSVDLLLAESDPSVAPALMQSAACPGPAGVGLLVDALVPAFSAVVPPEVAEQMILTVEPQFRQGLYVNGAVLGRPDAIQLLAQGTAGQAEAFLGLPSGALDAVRDQLAAIAAYGIWRGKALCAPDVLDEIEATIGLVNGRMSAKGISP